MKIKKSNKNKMSISFIIKILTLMQLTFGLYHGIANVQSDFIIYLIKICCLIVSSVVSAFVLISISHLDNISIVWHYMYIIEYLVTMIILLLSKANFSMYLQKFEDIDNKLKISTKMLRYMLQRIILLAFLTLISRITYGYWFCLRFPDKCIKSIVYDFFSLYPLIALDFLRFFEYGVFINILIRLKVLREKIEKKCYKQTAVVMDLDDSKNNNIKYYHNLYKCIADNLDFMKPTVDALVIIHFAMEVFKRENSKVNNYYDDQETKDE